MSKKGKAANKQQIKKHTKVDLATIVSYVILIVAVITVVYYMLGPSEGYIHSDCVDTMTWAYGTVKSGKIFSDTFNYPYLLPFGSTFLFYPFVAVFGFTMFAYRLSMIVFMALFGIGIYYTAKGLGWSKNVSLTAVAAEFIIVSSSTKLRELFWEHIIHYSLGAFLAFVLLALVFAFMDSYNKNNYSFKNSKKTVVLAVCTALWGFFSAFDGLTILTLSTIPIIGALLLVSVFDLKNKIISSENKATGISALIIAAVTVLGLIILSAAAKDISTAYGDAYSNIVGGSEWSTNLLKFLEHWTTLLGADYQVGEAITSGKNILAAIKMAGSLVLFIVPIGAVFIYGKLNKNEKIFFIFHWLMTGFILYGYVFGNLSSVNWRLSPIVCSALIVNITVYKYLWNTEALKRGAAIASFLVVCSCVITVGQIAVMPADYGRDNNLHKAVELLEENGLNYGYATYWNANILTLISSSNVEVRDVDINIDGDKPIAGWLNSDKIWYDDQPGQEEYFFLLTNSEYDDLMDKDYDMLDNIVRIINDENWVVIVMDKNIF